jgi:hypothetical protein
VVREADIVRSTALHRHRARGRLREPFSRWQDRRATSAKDLQVRGGSGHGEQEACAALLVGALFALVGTQLALQGLASRLPARPTA